MICQSPHTAGSGTYNEGTSRCKQRVHALQTKQKQGTRHQKGKQRSTKKQGTSKESRHILVALTWNRYVPSPAPFTDVKAKVLEPEVVEVEQEVQSCRGMTALLVLVGVVLPPAPDSLHWKPAEAGSTVVKAKVGLKVLDSTAGADEM